MITEVNIGNLPAPGVVAKIPHGLTGVVGITLASATDGNAILPLPFVTINSPEANNIQISVVGGDIVVFTGTRDRSGMTGVVRIRH